MLPLMRGLVGAVVSFVSAEWLLTRFKWANGGDVIALRSLWIAFVIYWPTIGLKDFCEPHAVLALDWAQVRRLVPGTIPWFGAIFAGTYASLQSRYGSQWNYLAGVYNRIKETDARGSVQPERMAEWKAGFIEDAEDLHLIGKPMFASVARAWGGDALVRRKFLVFTDRGTERWNGLVRRHGLPALDGTEDAEAEALSTSRLARGDGEGLPAPGPLETAGDAAPKGSWRSETR
jgi:hypothetical protein